MVYFVGAGSGAADLITLRGDRLLRSADMVIWAGSLVNPEILKVCKADCEIYDSATMTLEQVLDLMALKQLEGKTIVRLHTGDSSIYGAIREQMDGLEAKGILYEVVPGVSSFCGAAAALKTELTLPGVSQTVILTRLEGRTPMPPGEEMRRLATHGSTMVIFLSAGMLDKLQEELLAGGTYDEKTPAAIIYKATWPQERLYRCCLGELASTGRASNIQRTALIIVGKVLGDDYARSLLYHPAFSTMFREAEKPEEV